MSKAPIEAALLALSSPEDRLNFMLRNFSSSAIHQLVFSKISEMQDSLGEMWLGRVGLLLALAAERFCLLRADKPDASAEDFRRCFELSGLIDLHKQSRLAEPHHTKLETYLLSVPGFDPLEAQLKEITLKQHANLTVMIDQAIESLMVRLDQEGGNPKRSHRPGDVLLEAEGYEVFVGPKYQSLIRYPEGKTAIILMHDPKDGHFLLIERFSDVDSTYVLELPKVPASSFPNREHAASFALRETTGLAIRSLEKIGEIKPDVHMIDGTCEVYYGTFDLEESFTIRSKQVRDIKRVTEEGLYQAAFEGKVVCAQTLSAMSIWRAFEPVRKKREANSRRVRGPKEDATEAAEQ